MRLPQMQRVQYIIVPLTQMCKYYDIATGQFLGIYFISPSASTPCFDGPVNICRRVKRVSFSQGTSTRRIFEGRFEFPHSTFHARAFPFSGWSFDANAHFASVLKPANGKHSKWTLDKRTIHFNTNSTHWNVLGGGFLSKVDNATSGGFVVCFCCSSCTFHADFI